jgi:hypothetical protein
VCPALDLLVISNDADGTLSVFALSSLETALAGPGPGPGLRPAYTLGGTEDSLKFRFRRDEWPSGALAFTAGPPGSPHLLVVTDAGQHVVHVVDVVRRVQVGLVCSMEWPRGVTAKGRLVAVSSFDDYERGEHEVTLFQGEPAGDTWRPLRRIHDWAAWSGGDAGRLEMPRSLRFSADGREVAVVQSSCGRLTLFRVEDGAIVRHLATDLPGPFDLEAWDPEGGWLVACIDSSAVEFVGEGGGCSEDTGILKPAWVPLRGGPPGDSEELRWPAALVLVPGLGLVVREDCAAGRLRVFASPDVVAMASMSPWRVAWMAAAARACLAK